MNLITWLWRYHNVKNIFEQIFWKPKRLSTRLVVALSYIYYTFHTVARQNDDENWKKCPKNILYPYIYIYPYIHIYIPLSVKNMVFGVPSIPRSLKIETWNLQYLQNPLSSYSIQIFIELRQREHQFLDTQKNAIIGQTLYLYVYRARQANI